MHRKLFAITLTLCLIAGIGLTVACTSQTTLSALITTLGNASAAIATLEGNSTLATTLKADTDAAASAVLNWQKGSASTEVIEALNIVEADINLVPYVAPFSALIDIAIATIDTIITEVSNASPAPIAANTFPKIRGVYANPPHHIALTGKVPNSSKSFVKEWNKVASSDSRLTKAVIH